MMSPYEGERIFEAEMVRLHQCDRTLYACTPGCEKIAPARFSFRQWLADLVGEKARHPVVADTTVKL